MEEVMLRMREDSRAIFEASIKAVSPCEAVQRHLLREDSILLLKQAGGKDERLNLDQFHRVFIIGGGKASAPMARAVEGVIGHRVAGGAVVVKYGHGEPLERTELYEAGHPVPDEAGLAGAQRIMELLADTGEKDLIICLLSGGGSALLPLPVKGVSLEEKQEMTRLLLSCGADIRETNTVRKHISRIKGGQLARAAYPSPVVNLILSDVIGDDLDVIASGPTVPDGSSFADMMAVLEKYGLMDRAPRSIIEHMHRGLAGQVPETPKPEDPVFSSVLNRIVGSNIMALQAAAQEAAARGYRTLILSSGIDGEAREISRMHAAIAREIRATGNPLQPPACVISGGETTVTLTGKGLGGRNMEFALAAAPLIEGIDNVLILSAGTDGTDGPTDAAGAWVDGATVTRARDLGLDHRQNLMDNNSYPFFQALGDLLITGPTRTNVMDIRLILIH
ncbi:MAG: glycerate kinase [Deltaproteobacteria bacterium]|nr:glycerate kinase [Deltaproteobacteria bacterium]MBW2305328.1 glycerate kinase [Deltaproteobacteria bacterium]